MTRTRRRRPPPPRGHGGSFHGGGKDGEDAAAHGIVCYDETRIVATGEDNRTTRKRS